MCWCFIYYFIPEFDQSSFLGIYVDKVPLGQMYPRGVRCSPVTAIPPLFHNEISFTYNNTTQLQTLTAQ